MRLEWSVAGRPIAGASISGDVDCVVEDEGGALFGLIDGLGHGSEAAEASEFAAQILRAHAGDSLPQLFERCHAALRRTRGVVMTLARIDLAEATLTWAGVGNVEGLLVSPGRERRESVLCRGGVLGYQYRVPRVLSLPIQPGDLLLLTTDGVRSAFTDSVDARAPLAGLVAALLDGFAPGNDDARIVAARIVG